MYRSRILTVGSLVLALALGGCDMRGMLYPAPWVSVPSPPPEPWQEVRLGVEGVGEVVGWAHPGTPSRPVALFLHGNGENLETMRLSGTLDVLAHLGVGFLAIDYPGYGRSEGKPSEASLVASGLAGIDWLREQHAARPLILCGWSLGAAVAAQLAAARPRDVSGLVLMSAWSSLESVGAEHYPRWLVRLSMSDTYDSLSAVAGIELPALVVPGERDGIIPAAHGKELAAALAGSRWVEVRGAGHNDLLGRREVWAELEAFVHEVAAAAGAK